MYQAYSGITYRRLTTNIVRVTSVRFCYRRYALNTFGGSKSQYTYYSTYCHYVQPKKGILILIASTIIPVLSPSSIAAMSFSTTTTGFTNNEQGISTTPNTAERILPSLPLRYDDEVSLSQYEPLDLSNLSKQIKLLYEQKQIAYDISRDIQNSIISIRNKIGTNKAQIEMNQIIALYSPKTVNDNDHTSSGSSAVTNNTSIVAVLTHDKATNRTPRIANLSYTVEDLIRTMSYQHFLQTGTILSPIPPYVTDEEYISGAIMGLCSDLQQYGLGRATVRDVTSVRIACQIVNACLEYLLLFDFRNGPLRRKYDGCKYSLKALETFLYELAVTSPSSEQSKDEAVSKSHTTTLLRIEDVLPMKELISLKERIDFRDNLRETLIKKCRDGQKFAKQCIFALHRNDPTTAVSLLQQCNTFIQNDLFSIVNEEPSLRMGSFASVLEEYVEAKLFYTWLHGRTIDATTVNKNNNHIRSTPTNYDFTMASGIILTPHDFMMDDFIQLEPEEYIGGLCDLTGEIGRYAVQRGTARDVLSVKQCLYSNTIILNAIQSMDRISSGSSNSISKKIDTVKNNVHKIERMLYEISLSEAAGGNRIVHSDAVQIAATTMDEE
jgi:predicted translin family RNA/ssDNA-binding protein